MEQAVSAACSAFMHDSEEICTVLEKEDLQLKFFERQEASVSPDETHL